MSILSGAAGVEGGVDTTSGGTVPPYPAGQPGETLITEATIGR